VHAGQSDETRWLSSKAGQRDSEIKDRSAIVGVAHQNLSAPSVVGSGRVGRDLASGIIFDNLYINRTASLWDHEMFVCESGRDGAGAAWLAGLERRDVPRLLPDIRHPLVVFWAIIPTGHTPVPSVLHPEAIILKKQVIVSIYADPDVE
jgi:hypothetical protein